MTEELVVMSRLGETTEAVITDTFFGVTLDNIHGRLALRAYAYSVGAEDPGTAERIFNKIGREG